MPGRSRRLSAWFRVSGCAVGGAILGLLLVHSGPVGAQIPDLLPTTTTTAPGATTTTLLPALLPEDALKPAPPPSGDQQPPPAPALLPGPAPAPAPAPTTSRTTVFVPTPIAMRAARSTATTVPKKARSTTTVTTETPEAVPESDEPVQAILPYQTTGPDEATVDGEMELGVQSVGADSVTSWASAAAGLLAAVLLAVIVWIQRQVRRRPAPAGDLEPGW